MPDGSVTVVIEGDARPIDKTLSDVGSKAKTSLGDAFDGFDDGANSAKDAVKGLGDELDNSGGKLSNFSDIFKGTFLGSLAAKGVELAVQSVKALGEAALDAGKQAVAGYAEYEQLVGGMETLFKDASQQMLDYAAQSYKTAGVSANEYLTTATQFSAALIRSTGGDTARAAEQANKAIVQMSDNANKMGTRMEDLQNAYRGFARGNYTMLDNLALGYAGTKEGMEELLQTAEALSGVKYDINSYSDIVDAIGVVQDEMDITGTTAKEAASTVEGSVNSMKAAWSDWLTGLANPDADMSQLTANLTQSVSTALSNLAPVVATLVGNIGSTLLAAFSSAFPTAGGVISGLVDSVSESFSRIREAIDNAFTPEQQASIASFFGTLGQLLVAVPFGVLSAGVNAVVLVFETFIQIGSSVIQTITSIIEWFGNFRQNVSDAVSGAAEAINDWGSSVLDTASRAGSDFVSAIISAFGQLGSEISGALSGALSSVKRWGSETVESARAKMTETASAIKNALTSLPGEMLSIGKDILQGLINGIKSKIDGAVGAISDVGNSIKNKIKSIFGIHSPSRVFAEYGVYLMQGLANGISSASKVATNAIGDVASAVTREVQRLNEEIERVSSAASERQAQKEAESYKKSLAEKYDALAKASIKERTKIQTEIDKLEADHREKELKAQEDAQKKALQSQVKSLEAIKSEYEKALNEVERTRDNLSSKLGDVDLFAETDGVMQLTDLQAEIDAINRYGDTIQALKDRGIADSLLTEVLGLDQAKATQYAQQLLSMADDQYDAYMALWAEKETAAKTVAANIYKDELDAIEEVYADKLPQELRPAGETAMDALTSGLLAGGKEAVAAAKSVADRVLAELARIKAAQTLKSTALAESSRVSGVLTQSSNSAREGKAADRSASTGSVVSVISALSGAQSKARDIVLNINGREFARSVIDDIRAVEDQSPQIARG